MKNICLCYFILFFTSASFAQDGDKRIALVIGNSEYRIGAALKNPLFDANLMSSTLKSLGFEVTIKTNANLKSMQEATTDFANRIANYDVALFFYAGHGIQVNSEIYLIPVDAKLERQESCQLEAFNINTINNAFQKNQKHMNVMILDAGRNNPFLSQEHGSDTGFRAVSNQAPGSIIAFGTREGETAGDGSGNNGLFTEKLVKQMKISQNITDVFHNTRIEVLKASKNRQCSQEWNMSTRNFYFVKDTVHVKNGKTSEISTIPGLTDARDGKVYKTVNIGSQTWMAENLAFKTDSGCWVYDNDQSNLAKYGYLYDWETSEKICPSGWHLPSDVEWTTLINYLGKNMAGGKMKATTDWPNDYRSIATNESGFNALSAGNRSSKGKFYNLRTSTAFWSSTIDVYGASNGAGAYELMYYSDDLSRGGSMINFGHYLSTGYSVRCLKDN
jgi:uncharacterized protein (TIGR02145 family)